MRKQLDIEIKVGAFILAGLGLLMISILALGGASSLFTRSNTYQIHFPSVEGLITGAKVVIGGLQVGTVNQVDFDPERKDVKVIVKVARKYQDWVREDSSAEILTQGVLGDKYIAIAAGTQEQPLKKDGGELANKPSQDLSQFLSKGDRLLVSLNSIAGSLDRIMKNFETGNRSDMFFKGMSETAKNMASVSSKINWELEQGNFKKAMAHLNGILEKIDNGTGTLGALVNDPGLYYDTKALMGGANRNRIIRNLVRQTIKDNSSSSETETDQEKKGR